MGAGLPKDMLGSCREPQTVGKSSATWTHDDARHFKDEEEYGRYSSDRDEQLCHGANLLPWESTAEIDTGCCGVLATPVLADDRHQPKDGRTRMEVVSSLNMPVAAGIAGFPSSPENSPRGGMTSLFTGLASPSISRSCGGPSNAKEEEIPIDQPMEVSRPGMNIAADTADGNVIYMSNDGRTMWLENPPEATPEVKFGGEVQKA